MPVGIQLLFAFCIGGGLGLLIGWLFGRGRTSAPDDRLANELRQQLAQRETELNQSRSEAGQTKTALATAQANQAGAEKLLAEQRALHERALQEAKESQAKALVDLRDSFARLSAEALSKVQPEFLQLATQKFAEFQQAAKGDLETRQESIKLLVEPLKQQLDTYQKRLQQNETSQADTLGKVKEQLAALTQTNVTLATETARFRSVLNSNQVRGKWGEETLRRVVEAAGMSAHCDFTEQTTAGENRPDLIVKLPGDRFIIVDAKVPDLDFLGGLESADEMKRAQAFAEHAAKLKGTIKQLADRDYPAQFKNSLDYVVLFLPAESLFSAALEGDHEIIVWAADKKILLATPASLIALLRSVSVSWQQHAQTENAQKIAEAAQDFYARVVTFSVHFDDISSGLEKANTAYNKAAASFQSRVRPAGERLAELGGSQEGKKLADISPLESIPQKLL